MGLDLQMCPVQWHKTVDWLLHDRISFVRDYELFDKFIALKEIDNIIQETPSKEIEYYFDEGVEVTANNPYGERLTYILAGDLKKADLSTDNVWNQAVLLMLNNLPADTPIVLWWC